MCIYFQSCVLFIGHPLFVPLLIPLIPDEKVFSRQKNKERQVSIFFYRFLFFFLFPFFSSRASFSCFIFQLLLQYFFFQHPQFLQYPLCFLFSFSLFFFFFFSQCYLSSSLGYMLLFFSFKCTHKTCLIHFHITISLKVIFHLSTTPFMLGDLGMAYYRTILLCSTYLTKGPEPCSSELPHLPKYPPLHSNLTILIIFIKMILNFNLK